MRLRLVLRAIVPVEKAKKHWMNSGTRFDSLTSREREIMIQATAGQLNKQIAHGIGITEIDGEGASGKSHAQDEGSFPSRAQPNGRQARTGSGEAATPVMRSGDAGRRTGEGHVLYALRGLGALEAELGEALTDELDQPCLAVA